MNQGIAEEFGQGAIKDDEFLPEREDLELKILSEMDSSLTISTKKDDQLRHNTEVGGTIYKYDLPVENVPISFKSTSALTVQDEAVEQTSTQALFQELECDKDTAFESFIIKMN